MELCFLISVGTFCITLIITLYFRFSITVSYLGWMIFLVTILLEEQSSTLTDSTIRSQPSRKIRAAIVCFFSALSVVVFTVLYGIQDLFYCRPNKKTVLRVAGPYQMYW